MRCRHAVCSDESIALLTNATALDKYLLENLRTRGLNAQIVELQNCVALPSWLGKP